MPKKWCDFKLKNFTHWHDDTLIKLDWISWILTPSSTDNNKNVRVSAHSLIPMELAMKIASKINVKELFCRYIVIPMWPEGVPTSAAVQENLFWQGLPMSMMHGIVALALEECEAPSPDSSSQTSPSSENRALTISQKYHRFMTYVHAMGMIVDDECVIIGSANINQRFMDGSKDTEIAMGAYQPNCTWAGWNNHPRGQVYGHRMSPWLST
ncbi:hypothetical protein RJ641_018819 [Dillenia turbinata]|uniref:phospholipase D n=1 Tax=Dillenia turbinata TaxID=194707 RepID=A0AAN8UU63_9MAGN